MYTMNGYVLVKPQESTGDLLVLSERFIVAEVVGDVYLCSEDSKYQSEICLGNLGKGARVLINQMEDYMVDGQKLHFTKLGNIIAILNDKT